MSCLVKGVLSAIHRHDERNRIVKRPKRYSWQRYVG